MCVQGSTNGTSGIPISFKVLPMVPLVIPMVPLVIPLGTNGNANGTIGPPNGTIGKISNGTIGRTLNTRIVKLELRSVDWRLAQSVAKIFFKHKKLQMKQISD